MTLFWERSNRKTFKSNFINPSLWVLKEAFFNFSMYNVGNISVLKISVGYIYYLLMVHLLNHAFANIQISSIIR